MDYKVLGSRPGDTIMVTVGRERGRRRRKIVSINDEILQRDKS